MPAAVPAQRSVLPPWEYSKESSGGLQRYCPTCKRKRSTEKFSFLPDPRCDDCIPPDVKEKKQIKQLDKAQREMARVLDLVGGTAAEIPKQTQLLAAIYREWGGYEALAHDAVWQIKLAFEQRPGGAGGINAMLKLLKMNLDANKLEHQIDVDNMTDQQLKAQRHLQAFEILAELARDRAYAKPLLRILKDHGLPIEEQIIEEFGLPDETKAEALRLAGEERQAAAADDELQYAHS